MSNRVSFSLFSFQMVFSLFLNDFLQISSGVLLSSEMDENSPTSKKVKFSVSNKDKANERRSIQTIISFENPAFDTENSTEEVRPNGKTIETPVVTQPEEEQEEGDDEEDNVGFEKLTEKGNKIGLFVYNLRENLIDFIRKQKVSIIDRFIFEIFHFLFSVGWAMRFESLLCSVLLFILVLQ